jgi:hypothetical protein
MYIFIYDNTNWGGYSIQRYFQQYLTYIVAISFIGRKPVYPEKTIDLSQVVDKLYHIIGRIRTHVSRDRH